MTDLNSPGVAKALSKQLANDIDEWCVNHYNDGHRWHLGASLIGHECKRYLWYIFRWVRAEQFSGRMYRLFNRGHREEDRFIEYLEGIGCEVWADDLENWRLLIHIDDNYEVVPKETEIPTTSDDVSDQEKHIKRAKADGLSFPQYRISAVNGHFGGSLDGQIKLPPRFGIDTMVLGEFKTNNASGFPKLVKGGMAVEKPQHYAQTSTYGYHKGYSHVLYLNTCKNNDDLHVEVVKLDHNLGQQMTSKAEFIITSEVAPNKMSQSPSFWKCKGCNFNDICHGNAVGEKNCRSCQYAFPATGGEWHCSEHNGIIPRDFVPKACEAYKSVTEKV